MQSRSLSFNVEPTFRCNLECLMCPRFSSEDPSLDMSMETYRRIQESMVYAHTVDLTGWGEPTLHRNIYEMIRMAKEQGCITTMTSNGTTLNEVNGRRLIEAGLDRLTISVDGIRPETYNAIRIGSSFERVTRNLERFSRLLASQPTSLELGIAFTIQETNASDLDRILPWMNSVGATVLHLKHLNVISNSGDWEKSFLKYVHEPRKAQGNRLKTLEDQIRKLLEEAPSRGIRVHMHSEFPLSSSMIGRHCLATPLESVYFSYEGRIAPCCHFGHHVSRYFEGTFYPPSSLFFGDIRTQIFEEAWNSPPFQKFRLGFLSRNFPEVCRTCYLLYGK